MVLRILSKKPNALFSFCRQGRQNPCRLKKTDFSFNTDSTGARYVCKATDLLTKKHREDDEGFDGGLMYKKPGPSCAVVSFQLYLSHQNPLNEFLFQRPKRNPSTSEYVWSDNMVVGECTLGKKMKIISQAANFPSATQTIQSGRQLTILDKSGFEARHIMAISGHKNKASIWSYSKTDICTKMSETLTTRCEVNEELSFMNSHQSSPVLSFLQDKVIINSSCLEITKNFNFFNCNVNIQ